MDEEDSRDGEAGFTLVEVLVVLSLLSLISIFIGEGVFSVRAMAPVAARIESRSERAALRDHLRDVMSEAIADLPLKRPAPFVGGPAAMRFLGPADPFLEIGGTSLVTLGLEAGPAGRLDLVERRAPARGEDGEPGPPTVLLEGVSGLAIRYAEPVARGLPAWRTVWAGPGLPALISFDISLPPGDMRWTTPLLVNPVASANGPPDFDTPPAPRAPSPGAVAAQ